MADQIFENARLASIYDEFDGPRDDLKHYLSIAKELAAESVLDIGCGTGCFAIMLAEHGFKVTGLDPAKASLDIARAKTNADKVRWVLGDSSQLPSMKVDLAVMTANVAQVFLTDETWESNLGAAHKVLNKKGKLVFEVRDPAQKDWQNWTREKTYQRRNALHLGYVESWCEVTEVNDEFVSFRWTYDFESDGQTLTSDSTLRFREKDAIVESLEKTGFHVDEIRGAPDRPKKEFVFISSVNT